MSLESIIVCRLCGKTIKRQAYNVYEGDVSCCNECNEKADEETKKDKEYK